MFQVSGLSLCHTDVPLGVRAQRKRLPRPRGKLPGNLCLRQAFNRDTLLNSNQEKDSLLLTVSIYRTQLLKLKGSIRLKFNLLYTVIYSAE